jgi:hypothetical protein
MTNAQKQRWRIGRKVDIFERAVSLQQSAYSLRAGLRLSAVNSKLSAKKQVIKETKKLSAYSLGAVLPLSYKL